MNRHERRGSLRHAEYRGSGWLIALALSALLFCLLLLTLPHMTEGYWIDEIVTLEMAEKEHLSDLLVSTRTAMAAPPLCHLLIRGLALLGPEEWVGRLPSLLFACATVLVVYATGRRLGGRRLGLWSAVFAGTAPLLLHYAAEARPYAHFIFFTAALIYGVVRLATPPSAAADGGRCREALTVWPLLLLAALGGLYSHFYFVFVLLPLGAMIPFAAIRGRPRTRRTFLSSGLLFALFVALVFALYHPFYKFYKPRFEHLEAGGSKSETPVEWKDLGPGYALRMISPALVGYGDLAGEGAGGRTATLLLAALILYGIGRLARAPAAAGWLGAGLAASVGLALVCSGVFLVDRNFFHPRYFVFQVPFYALFAGAGTTGLLDRLEGWAVRRGGWDLRLGLVAAGFAVLLGALVALRTAAAERLWGAPTGFKTAGETIARQYQPGDRVMILGPRSAFDENMFWSEHTEPRYPLRREPFFHRVGYLPTDPSELEWASSGPGRAWLLRAYYAPWPDVVMEAKDRFALYQEARQCDVFVSRPRPDQPVALTMFHVKHPGLPLLDRPQSIPAGGSVLARLRVVDRLPLVVAASAETAGGEELQLRIDPLRRTSRLRRGQDGLFVSDPLWIEPGAHALRLVAPASSTVTLHEWYARADDASTMAAIAHPRDVSFGGTVRFLGYDLSPSERLAPGDTFVATYYWRAEARTEDNLNFVLRYDTLDPLDSRRWTRIFNDHAGCYGLHPTSDWQPGELVVERYRIRIPPTYPEGLCALHVEVGVSGAIGTFDRRHSFKYYHYMTWGAHGEDIYTAGALEIARDRGPVFRVAPPPDAATREVAPGLALLSSSIQPASDTLRLRLVWHCTDTPAREYRYHVTLRPALGKPRPVVVRPTLRGLYPTYAWRPGETLVDQVSVPVQALPAGPAEVELQLATGDYDIRGRLPVGERLGGPIALGSIVWSATP